MIRYNWENIKKYTNNDINKILEYLSNCYVLKGAMYDYLNSKSKNWAREIFTSKLEKNSYLINIDNFIKNVENATPTEQYVYLDLASKRDIFTYFNTKGRVNYLQRWRLDDTYILKQLEQNRILNIDDNNIHFYYEEEGD